MAMESSDDTSTSSSSGDEHTPPPDVLDDRTREKMETLVETIYEEIYMKHDDEKAQRRKELLAKHRDAVMKRYPHERKLYAFDENNKGPTKDAFFKMRKSSIPKHSLCVPVAENIYGESQKECLFIPYLEDDTEQGAEKMAKMLSHYKLKHRTRLFRYGPEYIQEEQNKIFDAVLEKLIHQPDLPCDVTQLLVILANVAKNDYPGTDYKRIKERYDLLQPPPRKKSSPLSIPGQLEKRYLDSMDSYRSLWCRRCFVYDCRAHRLECKPSPDVQAYLAVQKQQLNTWNDAESKEDDQMEGADDYSYVLHLTNFQESICMNLHTVFGGDIDKIAQFLRAPRFLVEQFVNDNPESIKSIQVQELQRDQFPKYYSVRNYNPIWYNNIGTSKIFPMFRPCHHAGVCWEGICSCVNEHFFCTTACSWGRQSKNFFRGCECKGGCKLSSCTCFAAHRECDPNLCKCETCEDPPGQKATHQACRNDNILMHRKADLLLGKSMVSGWGLFNRDPLKTGDFVSEYTGELISQKEAERRGLMADENEHSYLFLVAKDGTIDSSRFGNMARFFNHSDDPNVEPRVLFVRGEQRIGIFAKKNIPEQSELFFNYRYLEEIDQDKFKQNAAHHVQWMKSLPNQGSNKQNTKQASKKRRNP